VEGVEDGDGGGRGAVGADEGCGDRQGRGQGAEEERGEEGPQADGPETNQQGNHIAWGFHSQEVNFRLECYFPDV